MGNITIQGDLTGDVPGGEVGGASNLTTVGAIPYVSAAGTLNQDPTALFWDAANDRATFGVAKIGTGFAGAAEFSVATSFGTANFALLQTGTQTILNGSRIDFRIGNTDAMLVAPTTRNLLIGGTTDDGAPVQVFNSGVSTTLGQFSNNLRLNNQQNTVVGAGSEISFRGQGTALNTAIYAAISAPITGAGAGGSAGYLSFSTKLLGVDTALTERMRIASGGNLLIGTTTDDGSNKLQVAGHAIVTNSGNTSLTLKTTTASALIRSVYDYGGSRRGFIDYDTAAYGFVVRTDEVAKLTLSSTGTLQLYNETPTTGSTKAVVRAGAGQSGNLQEWQNSAGAVVASVTANGTFYAPAASFYNGSVALGYDIPGEFQLASAGLVRWTSGSLGGTKDLSLSRAAAGVLQVGDGGSNANGKVRAAEFTLSGALSQFSVSRRDNSNPAFSIYSGSGNLQFYDNGIDADTLTLATGGTMTLYNSKATTGVTKTVIRAGAGQSTTNLTEWQNAAGTVLGFVRGSDGLLGSTVLSTADIQTAALSNSGSGYTAGLNLRSAGGIGWSSTGNWFDAKDLSLSRASAGVLQVGDGGSNANGYIGFGNGAGIIGTANSLGLIYTAGQIEFRSPTASRLMTLGGTGTISVYNETATTGVTKAVIRAGAGQSTTNLTEWQNSAGAALAYISSGGNVVSNASVYAGASGYILWQTRTSINSPSDGVLALYNSTQSDFSRLQFGGATSSFPALKRSSAILQARLADDSANTQIQASRFISDQTTPAASTDAGTAGAIWADANYIYVQTGSSTVKRIALTTF